MMVLRPAAMLSIWVSCAGVSGRGRHAPVDCLSDAFMSGSLATVEADGFEPGRKEFTRMI